MPTPKTTPKPATRKRAAAKTTPVVTGKNDAPTAKVKHFRIPDPVWEPFVAKCERLGYGVSERVRQLMRDDVANG